MTEFIQLLNNTTKRIAPFFQHSIFIIPSLNLTSFFLLFSYRLKLFFDAMMVVVATVTNGSWEYLCQLHNALKARKNCQNVWLTESLLRGSGIRCTCTPRFWKKGLKYSFKLNLGMNYANVHPLILAHYNKPVTEFAGGKSKVDFFQILN